MNKKAQAAMEFLMTYGWAILVVLVAIGALAYFGVLNPGRYLPSSCIVAPGIGCNDHLVSSDGSATIILTNGMGVQLSGVSLRLGSFATTGTSCGTTMTDGGNCTFTWNAGTLTDVGAAQSKYKANLNFTYTPEGGVSHSKVGTLTTSVEG